MGINAAEKFAKRQRFFPVWMQSHRSSCSVLLPALIHLNIPAGVLILSLTSWAGEAEFLALLPNMRQQQNLAEIFF